MLRSAESILAAVESLPAVTVQIDDAETEAGIRVGARVVARIDLQNGGVLVDTPVDRMATVQGAFPSSRATADGIAFDLADSHGRTEALAAIRRRVNVERLIWQFRVASP